jgi:PhnB protein
MPTNVKPIPEGFHTVTPFITVHGAANFIEFLKSAFNAEEIHSYKLPDGTVMHAEIRIGNSPIMLAEASEQFKAMPCMLHLYVNDTDTIYNQAIQAGAKSLREPEDQFYGDRSAGVLDSHGNMWWIATHVEDLTPAEIVERQKKLRNK